ncbi:hypothetical protein C8R45DRAFT_925587 [Mycena sanguinolenta]|nr:hypothetical protein C8R45DRAFT_925587 [Mycena sanguinolenta]
MLHKFGRAWSRCEFSATKSPHILLDPFFRRLDKFTGLQSLHAEKIQFTQSRIATLCRAPLLVEVRLVECGVTAGEDIDTTSLQLDPLTPSRLPPRGGIEVPPSCESRSRHPRIPPSGRINNRIERFDHVVQLGDRGRPIRIPSGWNFPDGRLLAVAGALQLQFAAEYTFMLDHVCSFFPKLAELRVRIYSRVQIADVDRIHLMLICLSRVANSFIELGNASGLPPGLERIAFTWNIQGPRRLQVEELSGQTAAPAFSNLRDALVANYPALRTIWLDGHNFLYLWCKTLYGIEQDVATTMHEAQYMRVRFDDFWEN